MLGKTGSLGSLSNEGANGVIGPDEFAAVVVTEIPVLTSVVVVVGSEAPCLSTLDVATAVAVLGTDNDFNTSWTNVGMSCLLKGSSRFS